MIGKVIYVGNGKVADARTGNLVSLRDVAIEWNAMIESLDGISRISDAMAHSARLNKAWPIGADIAAWASAIKTALAKRERGAK